MNGLLALFNVRRDEGRLVLLLFLQSFLLGMANYLVQTAGFARLPGKYGARTLPWSYMANAAVIPLITLIYLPLGKRLPFATRLSAILGSLSCSSEAPGWPCR